MRFRVTVWILNVMDRQYLPSRAFGAVGDKNMRDDKRTNQRSMVQYITLDIL